MLTLQFLLMLSSIMFAKCGGNFSKHSSSIGWDMLPTNDFIAECNPDMISFEIVTGYVFSASNKLLDSLPGTLMLTDCLEACQGNEMCDSVNYETGLCVLFSSNADKLSGTLTKSQFPVFTIYAQKLCLALRPCPRAWCFDRVQGYRLNGEVRKSGRISSRKGCLEMCLGESEFTCRSANYHESTGLCQLLQMDRNALAGTNSFHKHIGYEHLENNCAEEPSKLCEFKRYSGKILKTVDSVYQDISSIDECRDLCLNSPFRCHSFDFADTGDMVCRLSHHSKATLSDVQDPYLDVPEAATYELSSCYNVSIECRTNEIVTRIRTSKLFDGKVYAKNSPHLCSIDVRNSVDFELRLAYNELSCNVKQIEPGRFTTNIVIQHHDTVVTSSDLGLAIACQYDLTNKSVSSENDINIKGDIGSALSEEVIVDSPNVIMKITSRDGSGVTRSAQVGDPLALRFEILDDQSPYEIFVRELIAMDGADNGEIILIDSTGCPTDYFIMGPLSKISSTGKILASHFDAFKFPSSDIVQFRALVTPCMPTCEPTRCFLDDVKDQEVDFSSYGRKRRSFNFKEPENDLKPESMKKNSIEDLFLVQSIQVTDKFGFHKETIKENISKSDGTKFLYANERRICLETIGWTLTSVVFVLVQVAIIAFWSYFYLRRTKQCTHCLESRPCRRGASVVSLSTSDKRSHLSFTIPKLCSLGGKHSRQF